MLFWHYTTLFQNAKYIIALLILPYGNCLERALFFFSRNMLDRPTNSECHLLPPDAKSLQMQAKRCGPPQTSTQDLSYWIKPLAHQASYPAFGKDQCLLLQKMEEGRKGGLLNTLACCTQIALGHCKCALGFFKLKTKTGWIQLKGHFHIDKTALPQLATVKSTGRLMLD